MSDTSLAAEFLFDLTLTTAPDPRTFITSGPHGNHGAVAISGGSFKGPKLAGEVLTPAGDWLTVRPNGAIHLDVRVSLVTEDGASILMHYNGVGSPAVDGKHQVRSAPLFETGDERYAWLNDIQAVGIGEADVAEAVVRYQVYALR